jgi:hypothetical protein
MVDKGWSRGHINKAIGRIRRCFKWAVENELVRPDMYHGLMAVSGLRKGRSEAKETDPVLPVDDETVQSTLPHLTSVVADMVRFQRITGCRPQDVCNLRPAMWICREKSGCTVQQLTRRNIMDESESSRSGQKGRKFCESICREKRMRIASAQWIRRKNVGRIVMRAERPGFHVATDQEQIVSEHRNGLRGNSTQPTVTAERSTVPAILLSPHPNRFASAMTKARGNGTID